MPGKILSSLNFLTERRPGGKGFRSGILGRAIDDVYAAIDTAFQSIEAALQTGAAAGGVKGANLRFTAATAVGALPPCTVPVCLRLTVADIASANNDWTGLVGKHKVIGFEVHELAGGHADNSYQLQLAAGTVLSAAIKPGGTAGDHARDASIIVAGDIDVLASGAGIRIAHVKVGGSALAVCTVWLLPVA